MKASPKPSGLTRRAILALILMAPIAALANNRGKKRVGGRGRSGKGSRYVKR